MLCSNFKNFLEFLFGEMGIISDIYMLPSSLLLDFAYEKESLIVVENVTHNHTEFMRMSHIAI